MLAIFFGKSTTKRLNDYLKSELINLWIIGILVFTGLLSSCSIENTGSPENPMGLKSPVNQAAWASLLDYMHFVEMTGDQATNLTFDYDDKEAETGFVTVTIESNFPNTVTKSFYRVQFKILCSGGGNNWTCPKGYEFDSISGSKNVQKTVLCRGIGRLDSCNK